MEALLRWNHPTRGMVPPAEVIPVAESNGLIVPIGRWVLVEAVRWAALWRQSVPDLRMSVNVSVHQLCEQGFAADVERILTAAGLPPEALIVEVTESALIADHDETIGALKQLAASGIAIALDDFGTGYSSLSYLQRFPVHILKIDRSFVSGEVGAQSNRLVQTVVDLGRAYDLEVVAEGSRTRNNYAPSSRWVAVWAKGISWGGPPNLGRYSAPSRSLPRTWLPRARP